MSTRFRSILLGFTAATLGISTNSLAIDVDAAKALARQSNCFKCHGVDKGKDGPAWKEVASKQRGKADAEETLIKHITTGPKVKFPDGHEEEHTIVKSKNPDEIKNLVDWILSLQ